MSMVLIPASVRGCPPFCHVTVGSGDPDTRQMREAGRVMLTSVEGEVSLMRGVTEDGNGIDRSGGGAVGVGEISWNNICCTYL